MKPRKYGLRGGVKYGAIHTLVSFIFVEILLSLAIVISQDRLRFIYFGDFSDISMVFCFYLFGGEAGDTCRVSRSLLKNFE